MSLPENLYKYRSCEQQDIFNGVANEYEKYRLDYPKELYDCIFNVIGNYNKDGDALEIGIGTGKATLPFIQYGYNIDAIEPSYSLMKIAKNKFFGFNNINFYESRFEDFITSKKYDLIYAASSFQWLRFNNRLDIIASLLKENGFFVKFKTVTIIDDITNENHRLIDCYLRFIPDYLPVERKRHTINNCNVSLQEILRKEYYNMHRFTVKDYISFCNTYTEYCMLPKTLRENFESEILNTLLKDDILAIKQKCTLEIMKKILPR